MSFNDYIYWQTLQETGKTPEEMYEYEHPEVVRCKECRLNETDDCPMVYYTPLEDGGIETRWWNRPDDYCSWGEREGE